MALCRVPVLGRWLDLAKDQIAPDEIPTRRLAGFKHRESARGGVKHQIPLACRGENQLLLHFKGLGVSVGLALQSLAPYIGDVVQRPGLFGVSGVLLDHDEILASSATAIAHANSLLIPCEHIDDGKRRSVGKPRLDPLK